MFGLPKVRGEIHFEDFSGSVRDITESAANVVMKLEDCITLSLVPELQQRKIVKSLGEVDDKLIATPRDQGLLERKGALQSDLLAVETTLKRVKSAALLGRKLHPFEVVKRLWGKHAEVVLKSPRVKLKAPQRTALRRALAAAEDGPFDPAGWTNELQVAQQSGYLRQLSLSSNSLGFPLVGLRQLRNPKNVAKADAQSVIAATFQFDDLPSTTTNEYVVEIHSEVLRESLGLCASYPPIHGDDIMAFEGDGAEYGHPSRVQTPKT